MGRFAPSLVPPGSLGLALALLAAVPGFPGESPAEPNRVAMALGRDGTNPLRPASPAAASVDDVFELFKVRRSVRAYQPTPVPKEHLLRILDAARMAPTSGNQQPWKFLVIQDRAKLDRLREALVDARAPGSDSGPEKANRERVRRNARQYLDAPVLIAVLTDSKSEYPEYNHWDGPNAASYLMLAARALGYGTVFVTDALDFGVVRKALAIPEAYDIVCVTPLGVPVKWPEPPPKKPLDSFVLFEGFEKRVPSGPGAGVSKP